MKTKNISIFKMASLYSWAVSEGFDILGEVKSLHRAFDQLNALIPTSLVYDGLEGINRELCRTVVRNKIYSDFAKVVLEKYRKLVLPYLDDKENSALANDNFISRYLPKKGRLPGATYNVTNDTDLNNQFSVRDMCFDIILETLKSGSSARYRNLENYRKTIKNNPNSKFEPFFRLHNEMVGDTEFVSSPAITDPESVMSETVSLDKPAFSLEDYIVQGIAARFYQNDLHDQRNFETSRAYRKTDGITDYLDKVMKGVANELFLSSGRSYLLHSSSWKEPDRNVYPEIQSLDEFNRFNELIIEQVKKDVANISNPKYKKYGEDFLHSLEHWIKDLSNDFNEFYTSSGGAQWGNFNSVKLFKTYLMDALAWQNRRDNVRDYDEDSFILQNARSSVTTSLISDPNFERPFPSSKSSISINDDNPYEVFPLKKIESLVNEKSISLLRRFIKSVNIAASSFNINLNFTDKNVIKSLIQEQFGIDRSKIDEYLEEDTAISEQNEERTEDQESS